MEAGNRNDARIRGNAQQLLEKYKSLARDATAAGDRILAEYYMQHADHYYRVLAEFRSRYEDTRSRDRDDRDTEDGGYEDDAPEVAAPQGYGGGNAQHSLSLETAAQEEPAEERPAKQVADAPAEPAGADAPAEASGEGDEAPRRRRRGRPRKVKAEEGAEAGSTAENAA